MMIAPPNETAELFLDAKALGGESPVWDPGRDGLWWVDVRAPSLHFNHASGNSIRWDMPSPIGFVALADRGVIVGLVAGVHHFDPETGALAFLFHPDPDLPGTRLNEDRVDPQGRLWFGVMEDKGRRPIGSLWRWMPGEAPECLRRAVHIPNGLSFNAVTGQASFADNADGRVLLLDMAEPSRQRTLLAADGAPGEPDGCALDAEGFVWNARFSAGCVVRIAPSGAIERTIEVPVPNVAGICFGGGDGRTLFITSLRVRMTEEDLVRFPHAGGLFTYRAPARGVAEHCLTHVSPPRMMVDQ